MSASSHRQAPNLVARFEKVAQQRAFGLVGREAKLCGRTASEQHTPTHTTHHALYNAVRAQPVEQQRENRRRLQLVAVAQAAQVGFPMSLLDGACTHSGLQPHTFLSPHAPSISMCGSCVARRRKMRCPARDSGESKVSGAEPRTRHTHAYKRTCLVLRTPSRSALRTRDSVFWSNAKF